MTGIGSGARRLVGATVDAMIEAPIVTSFTRVGHEVRSRLDGWTSPAPGSMDGRVVVITGGTSGLGRVAAGDLARAGAHVVITGRDPARTATVADELSTSTGGHVDAACADMGDLGQVRALADQLLSTHRQLDVLVHNAGTLSAERRTNVDGIEQTVASQVVGPFLLTTSVAPLLRATASARVITMSSGGMYASELEVEHLQMSAGEYRGAAQYARAKRAQVTLNEMWAERWSGTGIVAHAMHPGWADTPGVEASLPLFRTVLGPLLRTPEQGADTLVWLASDDGAPLASSGGFWLDRRRRNIHRLPTTRRSDTPQRRDALWRSVTELAGVSAEPA